MIDKSLLVDQASEYEPDSEIINTGFEIVKKFYEILPIKKDIEKLPFDRVFLYKDNSINAFADHEGGMYYIAFTYGFFVETFKWLRMWKLHPQIDSILHIPSDEIRENFFELTYTTIILFVLCHELYHILNGHCDLPRVGKQTMSEIDGAKDDEFIDNITSQILETDADLCSVWLIANIYFQLSDNIQMQETMIRALLFGCYNIFILFGNASKGKSFEEIQNSIMKSDHPSPGIRFINCSGMITTAASEYHEYDIVNEMLYELSGECIAFERLVLGKEHVKETLSSVSFTAEGAQQIMFLNNEWDDVRKILEKYAHIPLRETDRMETYPISLDESGEFLNPFFAIRNIKYKN